MKKFPLCPSSWAVQFPFAPFPQNLLFLLVYKNNINDPCSPRIDMQGLKLSLALAGATKICSSRAGPLMESFLNKESKLPALEAS